MARIDRERLESASLPVVSQIATRFADLDSFNHVNNAAAPVILQEARYDFGMAARMNEMGDVRMLVGALYVDYVGEMFFPGIIEVRSGIVSIGRTSAVLGQVARQDGRPTMYAETVMITVDSQGTTPIPEALRAAYVRLSARWD
jgi:acyl-CoA thioester hydrolase